MLNKIIEGLLFVAGEVGGSKARHSSEGILFFWKIQVGQKVDGDKYSIYNFSINS